MSADSNWFAARGSQSTSQPLSRFPRLIAQRIHQEWLTLGPRRPTVALAAGGSHGSIVAAAIHASFQGCLARCKMHRVRDLWAPTATMIGSALAATGMVSQVHKSLN